MTPGGLDELVPEARLADKKLRQITRWGDAELRDGKPSDTESVYPSICEFCRTVQVSWANRLEKAFCFTTESSWHGNQTSAWVVGNPNSISESQQNKGNFLWHKYVKVFEVLFFNIFS